MKDVASTAGVVGFDCLKCPVAEYFKTQELSELCVRTWCALDFPLATDVWHAKLERSGSIAGGQSHCDFRWRAEHGTSSTRREVEANREAVMALVGYYVS